MNKNGFIQELSKQTGYSIEECTSINEILENNFIIGKNNKLKIVEAIKEKLNIDEDKANNIYNISSSIISSEIKNKLKHPFKDKY